MEAMNSDQSELTRGMPSSETSKLEHRAAEPTPEILLRSTLVDGFLNRSQSIGLYTSLSELPIQALPDSEPQPTSGKLSLSMEVQSPSMQRKNDVTPRDTTSEGDKAGYRLKQLKLNESFVRSSSTGVNFASLPAPNLDTITSSTSVSPTGFSEPEMSRSWSPISSVDDGLRSAGSVTESLDSGATQPLKHDNPLYVSARLLKLDTESSQSANEIPDQAARDPTSQHRFRGEHYLSSATPDPHPSTPRSKEEERLGFLSGSTPASPRPPSPIPSSSFTPTPLPPFHVTHSPMRRDVPGISVMPISNTFPSASGSPAKKPAIVVSRPIFDTHRSFTHASSSDIYISPAQDFDTFASKVSHDRIEQLSAPFRKEFTDMFTAGQLASLKYIVDLAKEDPHQVLLGLRHALESEIILRHKQISIVKNWNKEFWKLVRLPDSELKFQAMKALAQDFVFTSETYGRLIISEMYLPPSEKTVHPLRMGGIAGGQKFVCQGILFKFAMDVALDAHGTTVWMYGGSDPCNEYAMKSAKHEFNGIVAVNNLRWQGVGQNIRVALTSIIDFRGFRLSCQALLPIGKGTLVYGSDDGGTQHHDDPAFRDSMKSVCQALNLKGHPFAPASMPMRTVYGPVDLEGHRVRKAFYAVDLARLFPPESPKQSLAPKSRSQFFRMLRPELVRQFHKPLSSDAHTAFGRDDAETNNAEVDEATDFLQHTVIPAFAETLANKHHLKQYTDGAILVRELHRWGINLRYMGLVRSKLSLHNTTGRQLMLLEMILRCLKNMFRRKLRKQMEATRISMDSPYAEVVLELLNLFLGKGENSKVFWRVTIKEALREMFVVGLTDDELTAGVSLKRGLNMQALLDRFQTLTGVKLIPSASTYRKGKKDVILYTDLEAVQNTVTKHMQIVDYAEGALLLLLSEKKADQAEKLRLLSLAESRLKLARGSAMGNQSLYQLGQVFYMRHKVAPNLDLADVLSALTYYRAVIESSSDEAHLMVSLKHTLELYYVFVSNSVWLQKKLFGSELISPFLNPLVPLPSPTATNCTSNIASPSAPQSDVASPTPNHSLKASTDKKSSSSRHHHSKHPSPSSSSDSVSGEQKLPSPRAKTSRSKAGTSSGLADPGPVRTNLPLTASASQTYYQLGNSKDQLNLTASIERPRTSPQSKNPLVLSSGAQSDLDLFASVATLRRSTNVSGATISTLFHQHCCLVFEKLAALNYKDAVKDASRYVKDACNRQGDSLRWIFEVSLYSQFVRDRLRLYLQRQPLLSVPHCPQLFSGKQSSVVYRFLLSMGAPENRKKSSSKKSTNDAPGSGVYATATTQNATSSAPNAESGSMKRERTDERISGSFSSLPPLGESIDLSLLGYAPGTVQEEPSKLPEMTSSSTGPSSPQSPAMSESQSSTAPISCKLPSCLSLNLTECTPVTSTVLTAILNETPNLKVLILDHCSKISNKLASILGPIPGKRGPIRLSELSLAGCSKITDTFISNMIVNCDDPTAPTKTPNGGSSNNASQSGSPNQVTSSAPVPTSSSSGAAHVEKTSSHSHLHLSSIFHHHHHHKSDTGTVKQKRSRSGSTSGPSSSSKAEKDRGDGASHHTSSTANGGSHQGNSAASITSSIGLPNASSQSKLPRIPSSKQLNLLRDVTSLRLGRCRQLTDASLRSIASMCGAKLVELDMSFSKVSDLSPLSGSVCLRKLLISSTMVRDSALQAYLVTESFRGLHELDVANCHLGDHLLDPLTGNIHMRALNLSGNAVGDNTLIKLSHYAPHLSDLDVGTVTLDNREVLVSLAERLPHLTRLKMVNAQNGINGALISMQKSHVPIKHLEVPWCSVRDIVVHGLGAFPSLHSIDLTGSQLSNAPLEKLKFCVNLTNLNLSWCTQLVDPTIVEVTSECVKLTTLAIAHCQQVTSHCLHRLPRTLTTLDMSHCPNILDLQPLRSQCIHLLNLNLASCAIPEERLLGLFGSGISLRSINLKGCKQVSSKFVSRMAKYCPLLHKAILDECVSITQEGLLPLLIECPYLQRITLTGIANVSDHAILVAVASHGLRHLKEINLSGCKNITDAAVTAIARNCALLNDLSLSGCSLVTSRSIIELADNCQILLTLNIFGCKLIKSDVLVHLATRCKVLEKVSGAMNAGIDASTLKNLPFKVE